MLEDVNGKMLSKEVKYCFFRATKYGLFYIGYGMPTLDKTDSIRSNGTFPFIPLPPQSRRQIGHFLSLI